jgi:hypothetical protein
MFGSVSRTDTLFWCARLNLLVSGPGTAAREWRRVQTELQASGTEALAWMQATVLESLLETYTTWSALAVKLTAAAQEESG